MPTIKLEINCCSKCPYGKILADPDPNDWFCDDDKKVICTHEDCGTPDPNVENHYRIEANNRVNSQMKMHNYKIVRYVVGALRPYEVGKLDSVPEWCPLEKT